MKLKRILILLVIIVLLPVVFYSAFEINSMNDTEQMINEIYLQQVNVLLFSVNQHAWDITRNWFEKLESLIYFQNKSTVEKINLFLENNRAVEGMFILNVNDDQIRVFSKENVDLKIEPALEILNSRKKEIDKLIHRYEVGYKKLEPIELEPGFAGISSPMCLLGVVESIDKQRIIAGMVFDSDNFIQQILAPKINETAGSEFNIVITRTDSSNIVYTNSEASVNELIQQKKIWIFPDYSLGIQLIGTSLEELSQNRLQKSMLLILFLDVLLILGAVIVYKNIKSEMVLARMKSDFVSNVSHELRTPLALIRMFAETMEMGRVDTDEKKQEYYRIIGAETQRLTHLINNILDFSKMEAGRKKYIFQETDLNMVVRNIVDMYKFHLENKGFALKTQFSGEILSVRGDENALSEVIINLLDNAMKYSQKIKSIIIKTWTDNKKVYCSIADKGIGIDPKLIGKIFNQFYRVESHLTHNTKGSGLGLSLVQHVVNAHHGEISVDSTPGEGSTFTISFPRTKISN